MLAVTIPPHPCDDLILNPTKPKGMAANTQNSNTTPTSSANFKDKTNPIILQYMALYNYILSVVGYFPNCAHRLE